MDEEKQGWILATDLKFKAYMDGDTLCVVDESFKDLQVSPIFFVKLNRIKQEEFRKFTQKVIKEKEEILDG